MKAYLEIEMPKSCAKCKLFGEYGCPFIGAVGNALTRGERNEDCPLVPIQEHGRLGDLDKLEQMFSDIDHAPYSSFDGEDPYYSAADAAQIIRLAPTIIPASGRA